MSTRKLGALAVPLAIALFGGCAESTVPPAGVYHPTLIGLAPQVFLGSVPCVDSPGAMRTYVGTVFNLEYLPDGSPVTEDDVAAGDAIEGRLESEPTSCHADADPGTTPRAVVGFALPSTGPVDCADSVSISRVLQPQRYRAEIQGYDRSDLIALAPGVPILVDPNTGERVEPRWTFKCGDNCPEHVLTYSTRIVSDCTMTEHGPTPPPGTTSVVVSTDALSGASCGSASGEIEHVEVSYDEFGQSASRAGACGDQIELDEVPVRGTLTMTVFAFEAGNPEPRWGTTCTALPVAGLKVPATCAPLHEQGSVSMDPAEALAALGSDCAALTALPGELKLELVEQGGAAIPAKQQPMPRYVDPNTCGQAVLYSNLNGGAATLRATLMSGPNEISHALCTANVTPAAAPAAAHCSLEP
jgi:hypothetical protein